MEPSFSIADWGTLLSAIIATLGVWMIVKQLRAYKQFSRSQLISELVRDFEHHLELQGKLMLGGVLAESSSSLSEVEESVRLAVFSYLGFFEKVYFLIKNGAVKLESVAELFLFRFLIIMHNVSVQNSILYDELYGPRFTAVVRLHQQLAFTLAEHDRLLPAIGEPLDYGRCYIDQPDWPMSVA